MYPETTIPCPIWCERPPGHEYEDESGMLRRHHERNVLTVTAEGFGDPYDVTVVLVSTEQVTMTTHSVEVARSPVVWVNAENLRTHDALSLDLDPDEAERLADSLYKAAAMARSD